ncbi:cellulose binding domain-containing protein [Micromonospora echinofusca]|uniref:cellulose binding domain-containing protein n=1 Tax=Micromonospora echinofusca TaxID=47858 RepID=UPI003425C760
MLRRPLLHALLAALAAIPLALVVGFTAPSPALPAAAAPARVMPLGDSITGSPGCWRSVLWNRLQSTGHTDVDFVGTLGPQGCGQPYDGDNEGHGGYLVTTVANQDLLPGWLAATRPDIVLMHFGTNDVWSAVAPATILAAYGRLVAQMRASNPAMKVLVAKIIPMAPPTCPECGQRVVALNDAIDAWAAAISTPASPVVVVDQWTGFSTATDTYDGVHPNASGDRKMADRWYPALAEALGDVTPTPTGSPTPTANPSPTPSGPATGCTASYRVVGRWQGGFQGEVTVRNSGATPVSGWTVRFAFTDGQRISQSWNARLTQSGAEVTAGDVDWNGDLAPGAQATFGFLASTSGGAGTGPVNCAAT